MYGPYSFAITGNTLSFFADPWEAHEFVPIDEPSPSAMIETLTGSFYDPYGAQQISNTPGTVTFSIRYSPSSPTRTVVDDAQSQFQSIRSVYQGKSGTFRVARADPPAPQIVSCTARLTNCTMNIDSGNIASGFVTFTFTFVQSTTFNV